MSALILAPPQTSLGVQDVPAITPSVPSHNGDIPEQPRRSEELLTGIIYPSREIRGQ
jgi:hypothetical protein